MPFKFNIFSGNLDIAGSATSIDISSTPISGGTPNSILVDDGGMVGEIGPLDDGELLIGSTGNLPVAASLTEGDVIEITNGSGSITISIPDDSIPDVKLQTGINADKIADGSVSNTEFQYLDGVTSNIQDQLDNMISSDLHNRIWVDKNGNDSTAVMGDIKYPCLTIQKAADLIATATSNADFNDATKRSYIVHVGPGIYVESVTFGTRPFINLDLNAGALIQGNVTVQIDQGTINGAGLQTPSFQVSGPNARSLAGGAATIGIQGDLIYESINTGSSLVAIMHVRGIGITGKITKKKTGAAGGYTLTLFIEGSIVQGVIEETTGTSGITLYADNCNDSSSNSLGAISGNVNLNIINDIRFNGTVVTSSSSHGRWFNVEFKSSTAHDFTGFTGTASADANSYESFQANVPTKGSGTFTLLDTARGIKNTPAGNISATNVQSALNELDTEKATIALSNLASTAINTDLLPDTDNAWDLGSNAKTFDTIHVQTLAVPSLTAGSVLFSDGSIVTQDNTNLYYDSTNHRLSVGGNTSPTAAIQVAAKTLVTTGDFTLGSHIITNVATTAGVAVNDMVYDSAQAITWYGAYPAWGQVTAVGVNTITLTAGRNDARVTAIGATITVIKPNFMELDSTISRQYLKAGVFEGLSRPMLHWNAPQGLLKLGSAEVDGDGAGNDMPSNGMVTYYDDIDGSHMSASKWSLGYYWAQGITLQAGSTGSNIWFGVDPTSLYLADNSGTKKFEVTRTSGNIKTSMSTGVVKSDGSGNLSSSAVLDVASGGTNSSSFTAGSVIFAGAGGTSLTQDNTNLFFDDSLNTLNVKSDIKIGYVDSFSRTSVTNNVTNSILTLGSWQADGNPTSRTSEGILVYGNSLTGQAISASNGSYARVKNNRFGLFTIDSTLPAYTGGDYYFRTDETSLFYKNNSAVKTFEVTRTSGNVSCAQINVNSNKIINVTDPTSAQDAATKNYVDTTTTALSAGDINQTSFSGANNQATPANVTGLAFANGTVRSFKALVSVFVDATSDLFEAFEILGIQKGATWEISVVSIGDDSNVVFSITNAGQVQYISDNYSGFSSLTMKFRAIVTGV